MLQESETVCRHCAAEKAQKEEIELEHRYAQVAISAVFITIGLTLELLSFSPIYYYIVYLVSVIVSGRYIIPSGLRGAVKLHLDINFLMTVAAFGAIVIGAPLEGASVMFLFDIAELLEEKAGTRVKEEIESLIQLEPPSVNVRKGSEEVCLEPDEVDVGSIIIVRPGEKIGLDGIITKGATSVDQSSITGESVPVPKMEGDEVYAGTMNQDGFVEIRVTKESGETVLSKIIKLVEEARRKKSNIESKISRFAHVYTPIVVLASLTLGVFTYLIYGSVTEAVYRGLTLLVTSCPCAFAISIPVSMVSAITGAARNGVLVKGSVFIEKLSTVDNIAFDKTGTLTEGKLQVHEVKTEQGFTEEEVLAFAASLEDMSEHLIALAITAEAKRRGLSIPESMGFKSIPGHGIYGQIGQQQFVIGNARLMEEYSIELTDFETKSIGTEVFVARSGKHIGTIVLSDQIREESRDTVAKLEELGLRTHMITGDHRPAAEDVAERIGISKVSAELLPLDKVDAIDEISKNGDIIMVGDGVNDSPAMASADVSIAMGVISSDIALETCDIALMQDNLSGIPDVIELSRKTMQVIKQNVSSSIGIKAVVGILAVFGLISLGLAIGIGDMGLTLGVILNALRLIRKKS